MNNQDWAGVPIEKTQEWQIAFDAEQSSFLVEGACPVCGQNALRRYYYLGKAEFHEIQGVRYQGKGSLWEWCSNCRIYSHAQAFVPEAWGKFQLEIDHSLLTPIPDVLDEAISNRCTTIISTKKFPNK